MARSVLSGLVGRSFLKVLVPSVLVSLVACTASSDDGAEEDVGSGEDMIMDRGVARGKATIHFAATTPSAPDEICVLPSHLSSADYKSGDEKSEKELCSYSFYGAGPREADAPKQDVAICPKLSSTNPGTDVLELLPNKTREQTEAEVCSKDDRPNKLLAKYKQSITCSYTPSILGYYHLSRALGGAGDVKPAVVRTMDLGEHKKITQEALTILARQPDNSYPKASWLSFRNGEANPVASRYKDAIYTQDFLQIYGGLQENARGEAKYSEINRRGADPNYASLFVQTAQWKRAADGRALSQIAGRSLADAAQTVVAMTDISEMLVLDYLMSQQDRFGNIHEIDYYYFPKEGGGVDKVKKSKVDDHETPMPAGGVLVKKMILKDSHMNAKTYANVRWLAANFAPGTEVPKFFVAEALFGQRDIDMLRANLTALAGKLHDACTSGKLLLDLDLESHLAGRGHDPASCEASAPAHP